MVTKARGPFIFSKYTGVLGMTAKICAADGSRQTISMLNLIPMHPATVVPQPSTDETSDITDSDTEAPEIINPPPALPALPTSTPTGPSASQPSLEGPAQLDIEAPEAPLGQLP